MKIIHYIIPVLSLAIGGCGVLDENPKDQISEEEAYSSKTNLYINTVAASIGLIGGNSDSQGLQGTYRGVYDFNTFTSDEAVIPTRGGDWYDGGFWQRLYLHSWEKDDVALKNTWDYLYKVVVLCNRSIATIEASSLPSASEKSAWTAELRAQRAMYYWYLMDMFGRVPILTGPDDQIATVGQSERPEIAAFIVSELESALPYLSSGRSNQLGEDYGHITKAVAYFILAKIALGCEVYYDEDWTDSAGPSGKDLIFSVDGQDMDAWKAAAAWCGKIGDMGYSLDESFSDPFSVHNEDSGENIFTIPMDKNLYTNQFQYHFRSLHYDHGSALGFACENGSCATLETLDDFGYGSDDVDSRFALTFFADTARNLVGEKVFLSNGDPLVYRPSEVKLVLSGSPYEKTAGARMYKYEIDPTATKDSKLQDNDIVLFRYADVLLMEAEAMLREGDASSASVPLNKVRSRAGMGTIEPSLSNILAERRRELCWEGWRRQDMIRFGTWSGHTSVFPIPADILTLNPGMSQNKGY